MYDQNDSDLQDQDEYLESEVDVIDDTQDDDQGEEHEGEGEQGARQEKPKSNFVDFDKIPDEDLRNQVKSRVGELYRQSLEAKKTASELQKLKDELSALKEAKELVVVEPPSVDLAIDDPRKFAEQQKAHSEYLAKKYQQEQAQQAKAAQLEEANNRAQQERIVAYNKRVAELGVEPELLASAAEQIASAGISSEIGNYLLKHKDGPLLVKHIGTNFEDLYKIANMDTADAVEYIATQIAPKAMQRKKPNASPPPTKVNGSRIAQTSGPGRTYR